MAGQAPRGRTAPHRAPAGAPLPPVRVLLPDGEIGGGLVRRWQTGAGEWVYRVAVRAWSSRTAATGHDLAQDLVEMDIPADRVRPVPGVSYAGVPVLRSQRPTAVAPPSGPAPAAAVPIETGPEVAPASAADVGPVWVAAAARLGMVRQIILHRVDCWVIDGQAGPAGALSTADCRRMLALDPQASACDVCDTSEIATG
ncbi:hypothetical protein ABT024_05080 [Streptomyces sp. NPDC002812]|uniref:hypothetical protein n=1 Tax=Streptomyces sp. NPDC002812 TaxID=3154434 RepID=UPI00331F3750